MGETAGDPNVVVVRGERGIVGTEFCRGLRRVDGWVDSIYVYAVEVCCLYFYFY